MRYEQMSNQKAQLAQELCFKVSPFMSFSDCKGMGCFEQQKRPGNCEQKNKAEQVKSVPNYY